MRGQVLGFSIQTNSGEITGADGGRYHLAILLGYLGVHKFYLRYTGAGLVYLLGNTVGCALTWMVGFVPNYALMIIAIVEGILYLTKSDEEFERTYVTGYRPWF